MNSFLRAWSECLINFRKSFGFDETMTLHYYFNVCLNFHFHLHFGSLDLTVRALFTLFYFGLSSHFVIVQPFNNCDWWNAAIFRVYDCRQTNHDKYQITGFFFFMRSKNLYIFFLYLFISEHAKYTITRLINQIYFRKICWLDVKCAHAFDSQQFVSLLHLRYALCGEEMM